METEPDRTNGFAGGGPRVLTSLLVGLLAVLVVFTRKPDAILNPQLWAEDGVLFLRHAVDYGTRAIWLPNSGYYHTIPRLVAWIALFPSAYWIPHIYMASSVLVMFIVAAHACRAFGARWGRSAGVLAGLVVAFVPHTGEVYANLTNVQWMSTLGLVLLLVESPPGILRGGGGDDCRGRFCWERPDRFRRSFSRCSSSGRCLSEHSMPGCWLPWSARASGSTPSWLEP